MVEIKEDMFYGTSNLQHVEDKVQTNIEDFEQDMKSNDVDDKAIEDKFWALLSEGDEENNKQAISLFRNLRPLYFEKNIEEALQNDERFKKYVDPL